MSTELYATRCIRAQVSGEREMLALYQAADVVLDTYPAGSYLTSLQVRSQVATLTSKRRLD